MPPFNKTGTSCHNSCSWTSFYLGYFLMFSLQLPAESFHSPSMFRPLNLYLNFANFVPVSWCFQVTDLIVYLFCVWVIKKFIDRYWLIFIDQRAFYDRILDELFGLLGLYRSCAGDKAVACVDGNVVASSLSFCRPVECVSSLLVIVLILMDQLLTLTSQLLSDDNSHDEFE